MLHSRIPLALALMAAAAGSLGAQAQDCPAIKSGPLPLKYVGPATKPAITPCDLMNRLYKYSDDSMMGRQVGTPYHLKAVAYFESEVRRLGLKPAGTTAAISRTFTICSTAARSHIDDHGRCDATFRVGTDFMAAWADHVRESSQYSGRVRRRHRSIR